MDEAFKIVTKLPLSNLWRDDGFTIGSRIRSLTAENIATLLRLGRVHFVVADVGASPRWIPPNECHEFWKGELRPHLAAPDIKGTLDAFPGGYCYFASEWGDGDEAPIIVCERHH